MELNGKRYNVLTVDTIPAKIVKGANFVWLAQSNEMMTVNGVTVSLIPGEKIKNLEAFEYAKKNDPTAYEWFVSAVARGYIGVEIESTQESSKTTTPDTTANTSTTDNKTSET